MLSVALDLGWKSVPGLAADLWRKLEKTAARADYAVRKATPYSLHDMWLSADGRRLYVKRSTVLDEPDVVEMLDQELDEEDDPDVLPVDLTPEADDPVVKFAFRSQFSPPSRVKLAYENIGRDLGVLTGNIKGEWTKYIPGAPSPLAGLLAGGLLGAGLGYGGSWLASGLMPDTWDKRKFRRTAALLGAGLGALPAGLSLGHNWLHSRPWNSNALYNPPANEPPMSTEEAAIQHQEAVARSKTGFATMSGNLRLDVDRFRDNLQDPRVLSRMETPLQAASLGLVESAYLQSPQAGSPGPRWVTPADLARISAGMGSGYLSGAIVGKALGALVGLPESSQNRLKDTGVWAGLVANLVPIAFGARP